MNEAGFDFEVKTVDIEENYPESLHPMDVAQYLAEKKAKQFPFLKDNEVLITADTTVIIGNTILGKPFDKDEAYQMLTSLSGKMHYVITGVCLKSKHRVIAFDDKTEVYFRTLSSNEIEYYIENFDPFDKAGGYGIQDWIGMIGITKIDGSYFNVMGLPIHKLYAEITPFNV